MQKITYLLSVICRMIKYSLVKKMQAVCIAAYQGVQTCRCLIFYVRHAAINLKNLSLAMKSLSALSADIFPKGR